MNILIAPTDVGSGLTTISLALLQTLDAQGLKVGFVKPIAPSYKKLERSTELVRSVLGLTTPDPMPLNKVQQAISNGELDRVLEDVVGLHAEVSDDCDVVIIEGLVPDRTEPYTAKLNAEMAKAMNADVLLVINAENRSVKELEDEIRLEMGIFG
ncbi:MAG: AAA family ATPase, partial [Oleibacter sp.]|nr:AAA family ATPase [Thalassolituus sp.]